MFHLCTIVEMGIVFFGRTKFLYLRTNEMFYEKECHSEIKRTLDERNRSSKERNKLSLIKIEQKTERFFKKTIIFLLNDHEFKIKIFLSWD